ncbi:MAG: hypothetical protein IB618_01660 [Candidatus Pacearchaeota archaeon]|nr:MAG: hypothetical protein IB618_01660 [Candidatus Pacearchaeota archaeon]
MMIKNIKPIRKLEILETYGLGKKFLYEPKTLSCFAGISFGSRYYSRKNIRDITINLLQYAKKILLIPWDKIYVHNIVAFQDLCSEEAEKKLRRLKGEMERTLRKIKRGGCEFDVCFISELYEDSDFIKLYNVMEEFYKKDLNFKKDLHERIIQTPFINSRLKEFGKEKARKSLEIASKYAIGQTTAHIYLSHYTEYKVRISNDLFPEFIKKMFNFEYKGLKEALGLKKENLGYVRGVLK